MFKSSVLMQYGIKKLPFMKTFYLIVACAVYTWIAVKTTVEK